jgi:outer membrane receptor for ferric coprogen and ferric-rhodotorulic acid
MKSNYALNPKLRRLIITQSLLLMIAASPSWAQSTAPAAPDAATLTKYDKNNNGTLDADERAAMDADARTTAATEAAPASGEDTILLSPFEVTSETTGYYQGSSMSGTRFNTKVEDLASSLTVITKEQMSDFAMLDVNDVFLYAASTEGTGTYTALTVDRNGSVTDGVQFDPGNANRVRGISPANTSFNNFETMGRVPVDPSVLDSVEVSRGPNANVFGLGNPSGTVNQVAASANVSRDRTQVGMRIDSYGGYRASIDVNRVLVRDRLAVRFSGVTQKEEFTRKPSGMDTARMNGMVRFKPFKSTTISGSYFYYRSSGTRPNFVPPRDYVSNWIRQGSPTWDPLTQLVRRGGIVSFMAPMRRGRSQTRRRRRRPWLPVRRSRF